MVDGPISEDLGQILLIRQGIRGKIPAPDVKPGLVFHTRRVVASKQEQGHNSCRLNEPFQAYAGQIASFPK